MTLPPELEDEFQALAESLSGGVRTPFPEVLGTHYETLRQGSLERRQAGAHYTPSELTGRIVEGTLEPLLSRDYVGCRLHVERRQGPMQWLDRAAAGLGQEHVEVRLGGG